MLPHDSSPETAEDALDPGLAAILNVLAAHAMEGTGRDLSLARLAKRTGLRQSTLRRYLTLLEEAGVVRVTLGEDGSGSVSLAHHDSIGSARRRTQ
ncbi:helix-turn-helix domain-containing protein [Methylotetracoccus oryzae]|uniref:helix-turn-helix domain-containing protein n=1 Tax=Methylotetracoccus oryzae TaxID=1919059 RepID=UPI0019134CCA|nr:helix-turn-helix domain-containing protein [Methylotetracoccus oryzae]